MLLYYVALPLVLLSLILFSIIPTLAQPFDRKARVYHWAWHAWSRLTVALFRIRLSVRGRQRADGEGNRIYIVNHGSYIDIPVLGAALTDRAVFVYKEELQRTPVWGPLLRLSPHIAISRTEGREAFETIEQTARRIREGDLSVVIFPEGTRSADGSLGEFRRGGFLLATRTGVPIVPVAIRGTQRLLPRDDWRVRPGEVEVVIGEPIDVPLGLTRPQEKAIQQRTWDALAAMLETGATAPDSVGAADVERAADTGSAAGAGPASE
jgi:1-acyl-sn-glycerol-3-phosphate acyltransferase